MLREYLLQLIKGYDAYLGGRRTASAHPMHKLLHDEIPATLLSLTPDPGHFQFKGADGQGNVNEVPWVAVFHRDVTDSAQDGYYVVWLLPKDRKSIILELGLGATQFSNHYGKNTKALNAAARAGEKVVGIARPVLNLFPPDLKSRIKEGEIPPLGESHEHKAYGKGAILSVSYPANNVPAEEKLSSDYVAFINLYQRLVASPLMPTTVELVMDEMEDAIRAGKVQSGILAASEFIARPKQARSKKANNRSNSSPRYARESKKIGDMGERLVFEFLKKELKDAGRNDLAEKVIWHQASKLDRTPGWDITSYKPDTGEVMYVEVKASKGGKINEVIMTKNEWEAAKSHGPKYFIYLVPNVLRQHPAVEVLRDPAGKEGNGDIAISVNSWAVQL